MFRDDIQALRGVAVLLVLLDHVGLGPFAAGYLGVDVFFVVSGFLITGIIARDVDAGRFSFAEFYFRRARRLLPAAYATILATVIGSAFFLTSVEMQDLLWQVIGALAWCINVVLYWQVDYFGGAAALKPLLHMWSLAVEEQFYLVWPLLLVLTPRRARMAVVVGVAVLSIAACLYWVRIDPAAAFYLLPFRAWELAFGGIAALVAERRLVRQIAVIAFIPALYGITLIPIRPIWEYHPGFDAAIVCVSTAVVILARVETLSYVSRVTGLSWVGNISYSLYLVHWPIVAFMNNAYMGEQPGWLPYAMLAGSIAAAAVLYYLVENPVRHGTVTSRTPYVAAAVVVAAFLGAGQWLVAYAEAKKDFADQRRPNHGLSSGCGLRNFISHADCRTGDRVTTVVWGDSYAMHLVEGVRLSAAGDIGQATMSACAPAVGLAPYRPGREDPANWANACLTFNEAVFRALLSDDQITTVVMAGTLRGYEGMRAFVRTAAGDTETTITAADAVKAIGDAADALKAAGKKVVVVGPPPILRSEAASGCVERLMRGKITFGSDSDCGFDRAPSERTETSKPVLAGLAARGIETVNLFDAICDEHRCRTQEAGQPIYRDKGHLSYFGSAYIARQGAFDVLARPSSKGGRLLTQ